MVFSSAVAVDDFSCKSYIFLIPQRELNSRGFVSLITDATAVVSTVVSQCKFGHLIVDKNDRNSAVLPMSPSNITVNDFLNENESCYVILIQIHCHLTVWDVF